MLIRFFNFLIQGFDGITLKSKPTSIYFPNREELSFFVVVAFPNASRSGLDSSSLSLTSATTECPLTLATYCRIFFDASVFPAPLSPKFGEFIYNLDVIVNSEWFQWLRFYYEKIRSLSKPLLRFIIIKSYDYYNTFSWSMNGFASLSLVPVIKEPKCVVTCVLYYAFIHIIVHEIQQYGWTNVRIVRQSWQLERMF